MVGLLSPELIAPRHKLSSARRPASGYFDGGLRGNAVPIVKVLKTHCRRHCEPFSGQKCARLQDFAYTIPKLFPGVISPDIHRSAPGAWTQTPTFAWYASVPIFPVLRNDRWDRHALSVTLPSVGLEYQGLLWTSANSFKCQLQPFLFRPNLSSALEIL